jgi:hypothetical protein
MKFIPKFLFRIEFYLILVLGLVIALQLATLDSINFTRQNIEINESLVKANVNLIKNNKILSEQLEKSDKDNSDLLEENYKLETEKLKMEKAKYF